MFDKNSFSHFYLLRFVLFCFALLCFALLLFFSYSTMNFFYLLFVLFNIVEIDTFLRSCRQKFGVNQYDLNQFNQLTIKGQDENYVYVLAPCSLLSKEQCGQSDSGQFQQGITCCQKRLETNQFESAMGFLDGFNKPPNLQFRENNQGPGTGIIMIMKNAKCNEDVRLVNVTFICDKTVRRPTTMKVIEDPPCQFEITIRASDACPLHQTKRITAGAIFLILLFVLLFVYLLVAIGYKRFHMQQSGLALVPHLSFWTTLFNMFLHGCQFSLNFLGKRIRSSYTSL